MSHGRYILCGSCVQPVYKMNSELRAGARFCSRRCARAFGGMLSSSRAKQLVIATCARSGCGKTFPAYRRNGGAPPKYCSKACWSRRVGHASRQACRREVQRRRMARLRARRRDIGSHTPAEWEEMKDRYRQRCAKCRRKRRLTKDHIIPLSKDGDDRITNIQPLCTPCNSSKQDRREQLL